MGLTISYTVRLKSRAAVEPILKAARAEARARKWTVRRSKRGLALFEALPHKECDPVRLDFTRSLVCEEFVKTSSAPLRTHVQIVEFLRAVAPLAKSLRVHDDGDYWETGDRALLKKHRDDFARVMGRKRGGAGDRPITFTLGAMVIRTTGE